jgi:endonuclease III
MRRPRPEERLISALGGMYSRELGIDLEGAHSDEIFRWLLASKLMGARIPTKTAMKAYGEFALRGVIEPGRILETGWDGLGAILDAGGYARYDFSTATKLLAIAGDLARRYGDLNVLHEEASDPSDLEARIRGLGKGIGEVTANIFLRELRGVWPKACPRFSPPVLLAAGNLGLERVLSGKAAHGFDFRDFEAALLRLGKDRCGKSRCDGCPVRDLCRNPGTDRRRMVV